MRFLKCVVASLFVLGSFVQAAEVDMEQQEARDDDVAGKEEEDELEVEEDYEEELKKLMDEVESMKNKTVEISVDEDLTEPARKIRMSVCLDVARGIFASSKPQMDESIAQIKEAYSVDEDKAAEMVHVAMIKNCFIKIDQDTDIEAISKALNEENTEAWTEIAQRLVSKGATDSEEGKDSLDFAPRHWELIREILQEERREKSKAAAAPKITVIGSGMTNAQKVIYLMVVFGIIFGGGYLLVKKLIQKELDKKTRRGKKKTN
jgi:hypothetical protein